MKQHRLQKRVSILTASLRANTLSFLEMTVKMSYLNKSCTMCGRLFKGGPRSFYCPSCRIIRERERAEKYRKNGYSRPLGSIDKCKLCGKDYIVNSGLQQYCKNCQRPHALEHDRKSGLKYYHANRFTINPIRNVRRRKWPTTCKVCGNPLHKTGTLYCCNQCRIVGHRLRYKKWYYKNKPST